LSRVGIEELVLDDPLVSEEPDGCEEDHYVVYVCRRVASPLKEGLSEGRTFIDVVGEEGEELACVPYGLLLVGWELFKQWCPIQ